MKLLRVEESVQINRPLPEVFKRWSSAQALATWFAPMATRPPHVTMDFREGGAFSIEMDLGDGGVHVTTGQFLEIVQDKRIAMAWHCDAWDDPSSHVEVTFDEGEEGTVVHVRHSKITSQPARDGQLFGWQSCLTQLRLQLLET